MSLLLGESLLTVQVMMDDEKKKCCSYSYQFFNVMVRAPWKFFFFFRLYGNVPASCRDLLIFYLSVSCHVLNLIGSQDKLLSCYHHILRILNRLYASKHENEIMRVQNITW
ncbi:hypothetical protein ACOSP7_018882 [Xanthoceras sorbifolium]